MKEMKFAFKTDVIDWRENAGRQDVVACFYEPDPINYPQRTGIYTVPPTPTTNFFGVKHHPVGTVIPWLEERGIGYAPRPDPNYYKLYEVQGTPDQMFEFRMRWC